MTDKNAYSDAYFHVVSVRNDPKHKRPPEYFVKKVHGYYCGSLYGTYGRVRLCVYKEEQYGWICVDQETGAAISRKFHPFRQGAIDDARKRLSEMPPEAYRRIRSRMKEVWVEKGLMVRKGFGEYKWQQPEI